MAQRRSHSRDELGTKPILPLLINMAVPSMIAMGVNALYNLVDTIFVGRVVGPLGIGGISIAFPLQIAILAVALLVGIGTASVVSRSLGEGNEERAAEALGNAVVMIAGAVAVVAIGGLLFLDQLLFALGATPELRPYAREYLTIILPGAPFLAGSIVANHMVRAEGRSGRAMTIMLIGAGLNLVLDPIFIYLLDMGVRGAAIATVIAQGVSFLYAVSFYAGGGSSVAVGKRHIRFHFSVAREAVLIGGASFVRQIAQSLFVIVTNNVLRSLDATVAISAFGVINKLLIFSLMPLIGIAQGFQPIAGYNYGARKLHRVREAVRIADISSIIISLLYFVVAVAIPGVVFSAFTTDPELLATGTIALRIVALAIVFVGLQLVGAVFFQSIGKAGPALFLGILRQGVLLIPLVLVLPRFLGVMGVWFSFPIADAIAALVTVVWLRREMKALHILGDTGR